MTLLKTAAAYIRVSDDRQDEYSPDSQLKKTREYAAKSGYEIPDEFVFYDDGISGKNARRRSEFNRMIALAKEKDCAFDTIYVWKFSRFARNQEEALVYKNLLKKKGVAVVSVSEPIPEGAFGSLIERIIEWMDEYYLTNLSTEVIRGMSEKASRGEAMSRQVGYDIVDKHYVPNAEADIVREVFSSFAAGEGMRAIALRLTAKGVRTSRGNVIDNRWVDYMLHNPVYIGKIRWCPNGRAASRRDWDNPSTILVDGDHEPLISIDLWNTVQERIATLKRTYGKYQRREQPIEYMLKGLVRCSSCGATLAMSYAGGSLQCCNYARGSCKVSHSLSITKANKALIEYLEKAVALKEFAIVPSSTPVASDGVDYDRLIRAEQQKLARAKSAYLDGVDTLEEYSANKARLANRIAELERRRAEAGAPSAPDVLALSDRVQSVVALLRSDTATELAKSEALHSIIDHIVYNKSAQSLEVYFHT